MADNTQASASPTIATDEISSVHYPRVKVSWGVDGSAVDASATNPLPITLGTAISDEFDSIVAVPGVPQGATYFKFGDRITADGSSEVKACPSGGYIVVTNVRVRSITSTDATCVLYFDTNNDQGAFDNGTDEIVEDLQLPSSADSMPGSNSGPIYQVGQTDDDLRVDVTGDLTLIVEGYTIVP